MTMGRKRKAKDPSSYVLVRALAHPLRVQILESLGERASTPRSLSGQLSAALGRVSYHVRILDACECLELTSGASACTAGERFYRATPRGLTSARAWRKVPRKLRDAVAGAPPRESIEEAAVALEKASGALEAADKTDGSRRAAGGEDGAGR
jgi:DNA-binding transcriptional ArsR family regulator